MAASFRRTKEDRRLGKNPVQTSVDKPFLILVLLLLGVGLTMLYSASYAQSQYDTNYESTTRYLVKQAVCAGIGLAGMWLAIFADVGVMVLAVLNAMRAMIVRKE